jgi:hypothetical protein
MRRDILTYSERRARTGSTLMAPLSGSAQASAVSANNKAGAAARVQRVRGRDAEQHGADEARENEGQDDADRGPGIGESESMPQYQPDNAAVANRRGEIGEAEVEYQPRAGRPGKARRVAAAGWRGRQPKAVGDTKRVARAGSERHVEHAQLGTHSTAEVARQHLPDGNRGAVEPHTRDGLPQIEHRPARRRSHDEGEGRITTRGAGRTVENQVRVDRRDVDGNGRLPIEAHRRRGQVEVRRHGLSASVRFGRAPSWRVWPAPSRPASPVRGPSSLPRRRTARGAASRSCCDPA